MIRRARIVKVFGDADNGRFDAKRVLLAFFEHRYEVAAYAKKLDDRQLLAEIIAALLGRSIGLPIPEPVLALSADGRDIWFASIDVKYPDLSKSLTIFGPHIQDSPDNRAVLKKLADWKHINTAIGFDEWIANGDRNPGNIIADGNGDYYLIDHNLALQTTVSVSDPIKNQLLNIKQFFSEGDEKTALQIIAEIEAMAAGIHDDFLLKCFNFENQTVASSTIADIVDFLRIRLHYLPAIVKEKIPTRQQLL